MRPPSPSLILRGTGPAAVPLNLELWLPLLPSLSLLCQPRALGDFFQHPGEATRGDRAPRRSIARSQGPPCQGLPHRLSNGSAFWPNGTPSQVPACLPVTSTLPGVHPGRLSLSFFPHVDC